MHALCPRRAYVPRDETCYGALWQIKTTLFGRCLALRAVHRCGGELIHVCFPTQHEMLTLGQMVTSLTRCERACIDVFGCDSCSLVCA